MRASGFRHRVTLQAATASTANSYGETTATWTDAQTDIPAEVRTLQAAEYTHGPLVQGEAVMQVTMRYNATVTQLHRFQYGSRYLYIQEVVPDVRLRTLVCTCREKLT